MDMETFQFEGFLAWASSLYMSLLLCLFVVTMYVYISKLLICQKGDILMGSLSMTICCL